VTDWGHSGVTAGPARGGPTHVPHRCENGRFCAKRGRAQRVGGQVSVLAATVGDVAQTADAAAEVEVTGARVFVEAGRPIAGGRWYCLADNTVVYERPSGERVYPALVAAATLANSPTWTEIPG
jgi:hypothetical protein